MMVRGREKLRRPKENLGGGVGGERKNGQKHALRNITR